MKIETFSQPHSSGRHPMKDEYVELVSKETEQVEVVCANFFPFFSPFHM